MKKFLSLLSVICMLFFLTVCDAQALIRSEGDLNYAASKLYEISEYDFLGLINKNELIGYRLDGFNMSTMQYQSYAKSTADGFLNIIGRLETINNSSDFSDSEKEMQINQLYQEAETSLSDVNSKTIWYLIDLRRTMPTITYQQYLKKFQDYYNSLALTGTPISVKK